jgi:hypothetical protein
MLELIHLLPQKHCICTVCASAKNASSHQLAYISMQGELIQSNMAAYKGAGAGSVLW